MEITIPVLIIYTLTAFIIGLVVAERSARRKIRSRYGEQIANELLGEEI